MSARRLVGAAVIASALGAGAAHADDVTIAQVVAATGAAPAAQVPAQEVAAAEARIDAAGAWPMPNVHVETNRLTARLVAGLVLPVPVLGTVGAARGEASARARRVRAEGTSVVRDLRRRAALAWLEVARADAAITAQSLAAQQAAELERIAQGRLDAGAGAEVDVVTAHAARLRADLAAAASLRDQQAAAADLAAIVGWDPARPLHATGALPGPSGPPVAAGAPDLAALRARLAGHPEHLLAVERVREGEAAERTAHVLYRPTIGLEVQGSFSDPTTPGTDVLVGVTMDVPLFSRVGDQIRAAEADTRAQRAQLAADDARLAGELAGAFHRWESAAGKLATLQAEVLSTQERASSLAQQAYREGARDLESALQAQRDLANVRGEIANARVDAAAAWVELEVAAGGEPGAR